MTTNAERRHGMDEFIERLIKLEGCVKSVGLGQKRLEERLSQHESREEGKLEDIHDDVISIKLARASEKGYVKGALALGALIVAPILAGIAWIGHEVYKYWQGHP